MKKEQDFVTLYCRFESAGDEADYGEGQVLARFIGVHNNEFTDEAFIQGITAYTLDILTTDLDKQQSHSRDLLQLTCGHGWPSCSICSERVRDTWFEVTFRNGGASYIYPTFGEEYPRFVSFVAIKQISGAPTLPVLPSYVPPDAEENRSGDYACYGYEVGQGMATLICNKRDGFLIDAGAGTPIKRDNYLRKKLTTNELLDRVRELPKGSLQFILSHGDADHWRLLSWDSELRDHIKNYVIPHGTNPVAFFDKVVNGNVLELKTPRTPIQLGFAEELNLYRTAPARPTSNNDAIIAIFSRNGRKVLIPGDCVYSNMMRDTNQGVVALVSDEYDAVVVPHHGDDESAEEVPPPQSPKSIAFFSAGNHPTWDHPRQGSRDAHAQVNHGHGYSNHENKLPTGINEINLLP